MERNNYEIMRNQMRGEFIKYDQQKMIEKFSLENDERYIYITFISRNYRIDRFSGVVEWSDDGFNDTHEADFNESMTIYDVLCYSKDGCHLSGEFCSINTLNSVQSATPGGDFFRQSADNLNGRLDELEYACGVLGEKVKMNGDVAAKLYAFPFLPVTLQFWEGDEEFHANLKFMFDRNMIDYMHFETIFYMMCHIVARIEEIMQGRKDE